MNQTCCRECRGCSIQTAPDKSVVYECNGSCECHAKTSTETGWAATFTELFRDVPYGATPPDFVEKKEETIKAFIATELAAAEKRGREEAVEYIVKHGQYESPMHTLIANSYLEAARKEQYTSYEL